MCLMLYDIMSTRDDGQDKVKHETHRTKEHITGSPDNVKHMIHRMGDHVSYVLSCL
jgi:hypothetical protein